MLIKSVAGMVLVAALSTGCEETELPPPQLGNLNPTVGCQARALSGRMYMYADAIGSDLVAVDPDDPSQVLQVFLVGDDGILRPTQAGLMNSSLLALQLPTNAVHVPPEVFDVIVENPDGQQAVLESAYTLYSAPTLESISISSEPGPFTMTLTGDDFHGLLQVSIGSTASTYQVTTDSPHSATAIWYDDPLLGEPGLYPVTITNAGGCSSTLDLAYELQ